MIILKSTENSQYYAEIVDGTVYAYDQANAWKITSDTYYTNVSIHQHADDVGLYGTLTRTIAWQDIKF